MHSLGSLSCSMREYHHISTKLSSAEQKESTTYVGQVMAHEIGKEPDAEYATRMGERALLFYSIGTLLVDSHTLVDRAQTFAVGVLAGTLLPHLATRDRRILARYESETQDEELNYLRKLVREWRAESASKGPLRLPMMPFLLRNIWMGAMLLFSFLSFSTFFITTVAQATVYITLVGISWAVAMWVPFAIIMEVSDLFMSVPTCMCTDLLLAFERRAVSPHSLPAGQTPFPYPQPFNAS